MKKFIHLPVLVFLLLPTFVLAQEKILSITVKEESAEFYGEQVELWKKVIEKDPSNADAWWNIYLAARYKNFPAFFNDSTYRKEVDAMVEKMGKAIPDTYEYNYIRAWNGGFGDENFSYLIRAYLMDSSRPRIMEDLFTHYYAKGDWTTADRYLKKLYEVKGLAPQLLHFCYNFLASTEKDGILFLAGDNDSYPTWMLQSVLKFRPDVAAMNVYLIQNKDFTRKALKKFNLKADESAINLLGTGKDVWENTAKFIRHIAEKNPGRKVYLPVTMIRKVQEVLEKDLYIVGTVFQYSPERFDNIAVLKRNWNQNLHLDYLDMTIYGEGYHYSPQGLPYTYYVYLYPSVALYQHYQAAGEAQRAEKIEVFGNKIAHALGDDDLFKSFVQESEAGK